jgi:hypothetical protein
MYRAPTRRKVLALRESVAPAWGKERSSEDALKERWVGGLAEVEADDVEDFDLLCVAVDGNKFVAGGDYAFFEDAQVKPEPHGVQEALDHVIAAEFDAEFVARHARLDGDDFGGAHLKTIADVDGVFSESRGGEIFAESAPWKLDFREFGAPIGIVFAGVDVDSFIRAAVNGEIGLAVAIEIESAELEGSFDGRLEDASLDELTVPFHRLREADLEGEDFRIHGTLGIIARCSRLARLRHALLYVLNELHAEIRSPPTRAPITVFLVKAHSPVQRRGSIERNAGAACAEQNFFNLLQQQEGDTASMPLGMDTHSAQMPFGSANQAPANRSTHVPIAIDRNEQRHGFKPMKNRFLGHHRVLESLGSVLLPVRHKSASQAFENCRDVADAARPHQEIPCGSGGVPVDLLFVHGCLVIFLRGKHHTARVGPVPEHCKLQNG